MPSKKSRGFTLMELLIAVAIFSGLVILALGSFARSLSSSAKVSSVRERTEVTRSIVNQISNDLRYAYKSDYNIVVDREMTIKKGVNVPQPDILELVLDYPGQENLVYKKYYAQGETLNLLEKRDCIREDSCRIPELSKSVDLLNAKYRLLSSLGDYNIFTLVPEVGKRPLVTLNLTFYPTDSGVTKIADCSSATSGIGGRCYSLKTSVVPGGY